MNSTGIFLLALYFRRLPSEWTQLVSSGVRPHRFTKKPEFTVSHWKHWRVETQTFSFCSELIKCIHIPLCLMRGKKTVNNLKKTTTMKGLLFPPAFCDASCCPRWFLNTSFRAWCLRSVQFSDCGKYSECDLFVTEELNMNRTLTQVFIFYLICAEKNMNHFNIFQTSCCCCGKVTRRSSPTWHRGVLLEEKIKFFWFFVSLFSSD